MDLINRYVYAVTKSFPEKQREDIEKELRANIEDMIEENQGAEAYEDKVRKALLELGDPDLLADEYRGSKRSLIGPHYYETYLYILKIVMGAVLGGISIAVFVESIFSPVGKVGNLVTDYIGALFSGVLQAFAWTTLAFVIMERTSTKINKGLTGKEKWSLSKLPAVPDKKAVIPLSESIVSIIFTTIFYTIFIALTISAPQLIAVYFHTGSETTVIPIFNVPVLQSYTAAIVVIFILSIARELLKLYFRRWMLKLSILHVALAVLSMGLSLMILTDSSLWNPDFASEILRHVELGVDVPRLWENLKRWIVAVVVLAFSIESIVVLYKGIRYQTKPVE